MPEIDIVGLPSVSESWCSQPVDMDMVRDSRQILPISVEFVGGGKTSRNLQIGAMVSQSGSAVKLGSGHLCATYVTMHNASDNKTWASFARFWWFTPVSCCAAGPDADRFMWLELYPVFKTNKLCFLVFSWLCTTDLLQSFERRYRCTWGYLCRVVSIRRSSIYKPMCAKVASEDEIDLGQMSRNATATTILLYELLLLRRRLLVIHRLTGRVTRRAINGSESETLKLRANWKELRPCKIQIMGQYRRRCKP